MLFGAFVLEGFSADGRWTECVNTWFETGNYDSRALYDGEQGNKCWMSNETVRNPKVLGGKG